MIGQGIVPHPRCKAALASSQIRREMESARRAGDHFSPGTMSMSTARCSGCLSCAQELRDVETVGTGASWGDTSWGRACQDCIPGGTEHEGRMTCWASLTRPNVDPAISALRASTGKLLRVPIKYGSRVWLFSKIGELGEIVAYNSYCLARDARRGEYDGLRYS